MAVENIKHDLCTLLREEKSFDINGVRRTYETRAATFISKSSPWNPFSKGKNGRDMSSEMLIPKHLTIHWQSGELRALKRMVDESSILPASDTRDELANSAQ
ncbi:uncharacterized protein LOC124436892 [Xenia sp. Carnegie-2017]|uniref:uncharacterized protein LOC124436892 n=1 Tax=Xenia sp. Carnegie-2017 TaxID=2897299 RepID=UPI001F04B16A|nr:uncharacterized protein LOC124436892 [Xenia sp. Carnegie-2017]